LSQVWNETTEKQHFALFCFLWNFNANSHYLPFFGKSLSIRLKLKVQILMHTVKMVLINTNLNFVYQELKI
jgi:hypothetical protein